ncbi:MAG: hypothetical protein RR911_07245 [Oscillospiraceae bacterium]
MKKYMSLILAAVMAITFGMSASAVGELHSAYTPKGGLNAVVDGTGANFDKTGSADSQIGTDFYIVDYQDTILTYQLTVEVPMYVALAVVGDGAVAVPSANAYGLKNFSGFPVNITAVTVVDQANGWKLSSVLSAPKDIIVKLENKNLLDLSTNAQTLTQIPAAATLDGIFKPYAITAEAKPSNAAAVTGYQFSVSYTLALAPTP